MVSRMMQWRNRLVEKGLDEEIADELVVGLPEQFASADDVRKIDRRRLEWSRRLRRCGLMWVGSTSG